MEFKLFLYPTGPTPSVMISWPLRLLSRPLGYLSPLFGKSCGVPSVRHHIIFIEPQRKTAGVDGDFFYDIKKGCNQSLGKPKIDWKDIIYTLDTL